jgi:hypothetical protein
MREPHFGAVNRAIARALEDGEQVVVFRVEDDTLCGSLVSRSQKLSLFDSLRPNRTLMLSSAAADMVPRQFGNGADWMGARWFGSVGALRATEVKHRILPHRGMRRGSKDVEGLG